MFHFDGEIRKGDNSFFCPAPIDRSLLSIPPADTELGPPFAPVEILDY